MEDEREPKVSSPRSSQNQQDKTGTPRPGPRKEKPSAARTVGVVAEPLAPREKAVINVQSLLEAGVHFGHQTARWSPAMAPFIYTARNGIHIINLPRTIQSWEKARQAIIDVVSQGGNVLFVGTKKQAHEAVAEEAKRCGAYFVARRWLGGMITNFQTIRKSIERMTKIISTLQEEEQAQEQGRPTKFTKKERLMMNRELEKLDFSLGGIRDMHGAPDLMFVIDIKREEIAIKEARRLDIPVVALVDTNCDPRQVNFPIPSNDDGTRAIRLFCQAVSDAVLEGKRLYAERPPQQVESGGGGRRGRFGRGGNAAAPEITAQTFEVTPAAPEAAAVENPPQTVEGEVQPEKDAGTLKS